MLDVFDLRKHKEAATFFLEMLNLSAKLKVLANNFDNQKAGKLGVLKQAATSMQSFTTRRRANEPGSRHPESENPETREGSSLRFSSSPVTRVLDQHDLYISSLFQDDSVCIFFLITRVIIL